MLEIFSILIDIVTPLNLKILIFNGERKQSNKIPQSRTG